MFGKKMIALAVAGFATVNACGGPGCTHGNETDNMMGMPEMPEDFDMASLEKMFAEMFGSDFDMSKLMGGMEDGEEDMFAAPTTCPAPTASSEMPTTHTTSTIPCAINGTEECDIELDNMDSSDSDDIDFVEADEGFSPVESFIPGFTPAQALKMSYPMSFARTPAAPFCTPKDEGFTSFEGFTCVENNDVTPMPKAYESLDSMDDSTDSAVAEDNNDDMMCCDAGMCGMGMCGMEEPAFTSAAAFNTTSDMCCADGMCGMEEPSANTTSAEDMFNNTNTCGDGFSGAMCGLQKNITSMFSSFNSTGEDNGADSSESDL